MAALCLVLTLCSSPLIIHHALNGRYAVYTHSTILLHLWPWPKKCPSRCINLTFISLMLLLFFYVFGCRICKVVNWIFFVQVITMFFYLSRHSHSYLRKESFLLLMIFCLVSIIAYWFRWIWFIFASSSLSIIYV